MKITMKIRVIREGGKRAYRTVAQENVGFGDTLTISDPKGKVISITPDREKGFFSNINWFRLGCLIVFIIVSLLFLL